MSEGSNLHAGDVAARLYDDTDDVGLFPMAHGKQCSFAFAGSLDTVFGSPVTQLENGLLAQTVLIAEGCAPETHLLVSDCDTGQAIRLRNKGHSDTQLHADVVPNFIGDVISPEGALDIQAERSINHLAQNALSLGVGVEAVRVPASFEVQDGAADRVDPFCGCRHFHPDSAGAKG